MCKVRTARSEFAGTCGHSIAPGGRFVVVEQRPQFFCAACGKAQLAKEYRSQIEDLTGESEARADGKAAGAAEAKERP
jgi:hypothetical protein